MSAMNNDVPNDDVIPDKKSYGLCGIQNVGNSCYMNTIIQCISNCLLFREYLTHKEFVEPLMINIKKEFEKKKEEITIEEVRKEFNNTVTYQLFRVVKALWRANDCVLTIDTFKNLFGDKIKMFYGYAQHDTQEALNSLFMTIENEVNIKRKFFLIENIAPDVKQLIEKRDNYSQYIRENNLTEDEKNKIFAEYEQYIKDNPIAVRRMDAYKSWKNYNNANGNIIVDLFTGYFHVETTCPECDTISDKFESFNCLPLTIILKKEEKEKEKDQEEDKHLNIPHHWRSNKSNLINSEDVDIYTCLDNFYKAEKLDDDNKWYCDKCEKKVNAVRKFNLWKKPKVLIILLKRFDYARHFKTSNKVKFPLKHLCLSNYDSYLEESSGEPDSYNLFAVSNHYGNMFGGHHLSYCKNTNGWYEFNDDKVKKICDFEKDDEESIDKEIVTKGAYLLFYELQ